MSAEPPPAWGQACPRSVRLAPDGLLVPAATLRVLLSGDRRLPLVYTGHGLEPWVRDGERIVVSGGRETRRGDLILCDRGGWGDLLRALRPAAGGGWVTAIDAYPRSPLTIAPESILGTLVPAVGRCPAGAMARLWVAAGLGAVRFAWRRIENAPAWEPEPHRSVLDKYRHQVADYRRTRQSNLTPEHLEVLSRHAPRGGRLLVCGCGAGGEVVHLARVGYRVTAFDALPEMVEGAREVAAEEGVDARFIVGDLRDVEPGPELFDAAYLTPLLYSFLAGRARRIAALRRLAGRLRPTGAVLFSARLHHGARSFLETRLAWSRHAWCDHRGEPGDWYTWYVTPRGSIGYSFLRRFSAGEVLAEARAAGFGSVERLGSHFVAARPLQW